MERAAGLRGDFHQRTEAAMGVERVGGLREDCHQRPEAVRGVGRAGGLREDFHQKAEVYGEWGGRQSICTRLTQSRYAL